MKKTFLPLILGMAAALAFTGCEKKGTVSGVVLDPFTGKPVEMPTIWMDSTIFSTQKPKYEFKADLQQGKFKFLKVPVGDYLIKARRSKYVLGQQTFSTTEKQPNAEVTLYIYSDRVNPGLYKGTPNGPEKISNDWVLFSTTCKESVAGYRKSYTQDLNASRVPDKKNKGKKKMKTNVLPSPRVMDADLDVFYCNESSVTTPVEAYTYPAVSGSVASHSDCSGFGGSEKDGIFANAEKGTQLKVTYRAEGLFEITGNLPRGRQILRLVQEGKTLQTYYFEVK